MKIDTIVNGKPYTGGGFDLSSVSGTEDGVRVSLLGFDATSGETMELKLLFSLEEWERMVSAATETAAVNTCDACDNALCGERWVDAMGDVHLCVNPRGHTGSHDDPPYSWGYVPPRAS